MKLLTKADMPLNKKKKQKKKNEPNHPSIWKKIVNNNTYYQNMCDPFAYIPNFPHVGEQHQ